MANEKTFVDGMIVKKRENAPDFVLCSLSIQEGKFADFIERHSKNGWVNLEVCVGRSGKPYAYLDTWEPKKEEAASPF